MSLDFKNLDVASLDYSDIVTSLTNFLKAEPTLSDLDYDNKASAVSMMVNILATATAYNGVYAQMGYRECFLSTAQLLPSIVGLASNSSVLLEVKKSASTTRNIIVYNTPFSAFTAFPAVTSTGANTYFFAIDTLAANQIHESVTLYCGKEAVQYGNWDFNSQSIVIPLTIDPATIKMYSVDTAGNEVIWTRVSKSNPAAEQTGYYYTVLNTVNGYLVTSNLPESFNLTTDYTVYVRGVVSNGSDGNSATIYASNNANFVTISTPSGGYNSLSASEARAQVQFAATSQHKCVTITDFENAIVASGITGTDDIDDITVANANQPCTVKVFVIGLSEANQNALLAYLADRAVAGINVIYSE